MNAPLVLRYAGDGAFEVAHPRLKQLLDKELVIGEVYRFERHEDRSPETHRHFFACVNEAWLNLPPDLAERFPSSEALRKFVLISVGHCDSDTFVASSKAEALRLAAFLRSGEEFVLVTVSGATVTRYRARSQSVRAQGKADFQRVKELALHKLSEMIGTDAATLSKAQAA